MRHYGDLKFSEVAEWIALIEQHEGEIVSWQVNSFVARK
jgi:hypothetical protein